MAALEVKVPDIGDVTHVPVIEILVKPGEPGQPEDSLVTLESAKATMDLPRPDEGVVDSECEMLVLGAGPGGYSAAFRAADLDMKTVLVERYATLGGVCLNVGCIPSKALLHIAAVMDEVAVLGEHGVVFGAPKVDLAKLLAWKNKVVGKLTGGLTGMAKLRKVEVVRVYGSFLAPHYLRVQLTACTGLGCTGPK